MLLRKLQQFVCKHQHSNTLSPMETPADSERGPHSAGRSAGRTRQGHRRPGSSGDTSLLRRAAPTRLAAGPGKPAALRGCARVSVHTSGHAPAERPQPCRAPQRGSRPGVRTTLPDTEEASPPATCPPSRLQGQEGPGAASYSMEKDEVLPLRGGWGRHSSKVTSLKRVCADSSLRRTEREEQLKDGDRTSFLASSRLASGQMTTSRLHCTGSFPAKPATVTLI